MANKQKTIEEMKANSAAWQTADAETRKQLEAANQALGASIGGVYDSDTGKWSDSTGNDLYNPVSAPATQNSTYNPYYTGSSTTLGTYTDEQTAIKAKMNENSKQWWLVDDVGKAALEAENKQLAAKLGGTVTFDADTGYWSGNAKQPMADYGGFTYGESPDYYDAYASNIDKMLNEILNRDKFSYNAEEDPMYQQYAKTYEREGDRAMQNTLAQVSARTGGLASSYATTAAQQANQYYMQQLADKVPELYQLAYQMYLDDLNLKVQDLGLLQGASDTAYNRYRDTLSDWYNDRDFAYGIYRDDIADQRYETEWAYGLERDALEDEWRQKEWDYGVSRDELEDEWRQKEWDYGVERDSIADQRYDAEWAYQQQQDAISNSRNDTTSYSDDVKAVAAALGWSFEEAQALKNTGSAKWSEALSSLGINTSGTSGGSSSEPLVDTSGLWEMGYGLYNEEAIYELVEKGEIIEYEEDGVIKFRRPTEAEKEAKENEIWWPSILTPFKP